MENIVNQIFNFRNLAIELFSPYFGWIKLVSLIISGLLLWGIIYFMIKSTFVNMKIEQWMDLGMGSLGDLTKYRSIKGWASVQKKLRLGDEANLKLAITEADKILDELLKVSGYVGKNMNERLKQLDPSKLSNLSDVWSAHKVCQRVILEKDFQINKQEAELIINIYKKSFQEYQLID
ncbi:MAG: hypothetical protein AAB404_01515 [Patescibacteria group bacterium]